VIGRVAAALLLGAWSVIAAPAVAAPAPSGVESLRRFFADVNRYTARFDQVVVDETGETIQESKGRLWIERPDKFRWDYDTPYKQEIVSDGERLWVYDEDLKQVTVRPLEGGLLDTPAVILAGRGRLEQQFTIKDDGVKDELAWVELSPKHKDSGFEKVRLGFEQGRLRRFELIDSLGQTTRYSLSDGLENKPISAERFSFTPPPGVDVVGER
jgi:outer membrane lipoprotein carrier protein